MRCNGRILLLPSMMAHERAGARVRTSEHHAERSYASAALDTRTPHCGMTHWSVKN